MPSSVNVILMASSVVVPREHAIAVVAGDQSHQGHQGEDVGQHGAGADAERRVRASCAGAARGGECADSRSAFDFYTRAVLIIR